MKNLETLIIEWNFISSLESFHKTNFKNLQILLLGKIDFIKVTIHWLIMGNFKGQNTKSYNRYNYKNLGNFYIIKVPNH